MTERREMAELKGLDGQRKRPVPGDAKRGAKCRENLCYVLRRPQPFSPGRYA